MLLALWSSFRSHPGCYIERGGRVSGSGSVLSWPRRRAPMDGTLIVGTTIFDGSGAAPFTGDVRVEGQRIVAVQRGGGLPRGGAGHRRRGATLMPGLIEPHGHLSYPDAARNSDFTRLPPEEHVLITMRNAKTSLDCGYTSVLSAASAKPRLDIVIRNEINAGRIPGPALPGQWAGAHGQRRAGRREPAPPAPCRDADLRLGGRRPRRDPQGLPPAGARGPDLLKLNSRATPGRATALRAGGDDRRRGGGGDGDRPGRRRTGVRARTQRGVGQDVRPHRIGIIYHANFADEEALNLLEANQDWCFVNPALGLTHQACYAAGDWGFTPAMARERGLLESSKSRWSRLARCASAASGCCRRRLRLRVEPARHLRARPAALRRRARLLARRRRWWRPPGWAARSWGGPTSWGRSSRAISRTCCWSTATR